MRQAAKGYIIVRDGQFLFSTLRRTAAEAIATMVLHSGYPWEQLQSDAFDHCRVEWVVITTLLDVVNVEATPCST